MAILPRGSTILLTLPSSSVTVYVDDIKDSYVTIPFERSEFSYHRLLSAPNVIDGSMPVIIYGHGNHPVQITNTCNSILPRVLTPDDPTFTNQYQRFDCHRYEITFLENQNSVIDAIAPTARQHSLYLSRFQADLKKRGAYASYEQLLTWQTETFSYLTSTSVSISGSQISSESNCLITGFTRGVMIEVPGSTQNIVLKGGSLTLEIRTIESDLN